MVTVSTSSRTKGTWGRASNADTNTTSTSYVDVTGYTMSVDNNHYYTAMLAANVAGSQLTSFKFVEGATDKSAQTGVALSNTNFMGFIWLTRQQNTQGSTQTTKIQYKNDTAGTVTVYAASLFVKSSNNNWFVAWQNFSYGRWTIPMKVSLVDLEFVAFPAGSSQITEGTYVGSTGDTAEYFDYGNVTFAGANFTFYYSAEQHADSFPIATVNNVVSAITFYGRSYQWTVNGILNPAGSTVQNHSGPIFMIWDYGGTQVTFT